MADILTDTQLFAKLIKPYNNFFVMGLCKNAGKTTTVVEMLDVFKESTIALTSIGRDGERVDVATKTKKPPIFVKAGTLYATAKGVLHLSDVSREILYTTGIETSIGEVVCCRALSDGYIEIAGPSMNDQIEHITKIFISQKAEKIIVDGAISRRTTASLDVFDGSILAVGASFHRDLDRVVEETSLVASFFSLPVYKGRHIPLVDVKKFTFLLPSLHMKAFDTLEVEEIDTDILDTVKKLFVKGSLLSHDINKIIGLGVSDFILVIEDASKLFLTKKDLHRLEVRNISLQVLKPISLLAITINPFSAYGQPVNEAIFKEKIMEAVDVPVVNLKEPER